MIHRLLIPFLFLIGYASHGWQQQTPAQILQQSIVNCYDSGGGIVPLKGQVDATEPIYMRACVTLRGESPHRDILNSTAKVAILLINAPGNASAPDQAHIESIGIKNSVGGGIALSDFVRSKTSTHDLHFEDLEIDTAGTGIEIEHTGKDAYGQPLTSYRPALRNVRIISGATAAKVNGRTVVVEDDCAFNTRKGSGNSGLILKGDGSLRDSQIHDDWGAPALYVSGVYSVDSMWIESVSGIQFDGAEASTNSTARWFAQPGRQSVRITNGSRLTVLGRMAFTDNGGGTNTTVGKCFVTDRTSSVFQFAVQVVAPAKN